MESRSTRPGDRFQVRLWDLLVLVIGAAYVLDVARRSRIAWGGGLPDLAHAIGLTVLTMGVGVGLIVAGQWVRQLRGRHVKAWAVLWRVLAIGWLGGALVEVAAALQVANTPGLPPAIAGQAELRLRLTTLMASLGMVGLILSAAPIGRVSPQARPRWGSWPSVTLAVVFGLAVLSLGHGSFPYFVLLAVEAVRNAMRNAPLVQRPHLFERMVMATFQALPGLAGCLATAIWVDDDLRAAVRHSPEAGRPRTWRGVVARAATVALAASGSAHVLLVSIPTLSPSLAEGFGATVDSLGVTTIALGFAALACGIAARSAAYLGGEMAPAGPPLRPRTWAVWARRVLAAAAGLACLEVIAAAVQTIRGDSASYWLIPIRLEDWGEILRSPLGQVTSGYGWVGLIDRPDVILIGVAAAWLATRVVGLLMGRDSGGPIPLDAIAADRLRLGRFLGWWAALTTAILASLPGLIVVAVTLIHHVIRWLAG